MFALTVALALQAPATAAQAVEGRPCTPEPTDEALQYGDLVTCAIDVLGDSDLFRFQGSAGEVVRVAVSGGGSLFEVFRPDGAPIGSSNIARDLTLTQTGIHTILVRHITNSGTGQYALALDRLSPPSITARPIDYGQVIQGEINSVNDLDLFVFTGAAQTLVRVSISGGGSLFEVFRPDGAPIGSSNIARDLTLTQTGIHTILVRHITNSGTATYNLSLQCIVGPCPPSPPLRPSASVNQPTFAVGDTLRLAYELINPGRPGAVDLYLGVLLPDGSIVFFTGAGGIAIGRVDDFGSFEPFAAGLPLATASSTSVPQFLSYQWAGVEPRGQYTFFLVAVQAGALTDGALLSEEILGLAIAPFSFP